VLDACEAMGRDASEITFSAALTVCCGQTEDELERRATAIGQPLQQLRDSGLAGTPAELVDTLGRWSEAGSQRTYLQTLDVTDLDHVRLIAAEVLPAVR